MKKYLLFGLLICLTVSCEKFVRTSCIPSEAIELNDALIIKQGKIDFASKKSSAGVAKIFLQKNGRYILGLEQMDIMENFDFEVYMSSTLPLSAASLKLFSAKSIKQDKYYLLPQNIALTGYDYVLFQNTRIDEEIAHAKLQ